MNTQTQLDEQLKSAKQAYDDCLDYFGIDYQFAHDGYARALDAYKRKDLTALEGECSALAESANAASYETIMIQGGSDTELIPFTL